MPETTGVIRRIVERDGAVRVSLPNHSGYFHVAEGDAHDDIVNQLRAAEASGATISFRFDARLNITEML